MKVDDVRFVRDLLDDVESNFNVDKNRVYAGGFSNGSQFTCVLGKRCSDRIAAIGMVAGQRPVDGIFPPPPRPISLIQFSGRKDVIGPYDGGEPNFEAAFKTDLLPVRKTIGTWARFDGCSDEPASSKRVGKAEIESFGKGKNGAEVVLVTLDDGGHTWPGGRTLPAMEEHPVNHDINGSEVMWDFFSRHTLK
jgi:polyhydroxybutyrate depolymerase